MSEAGNTGPGAGGPEVDALSGQETTGHEWDGIRELDRPLPRWWLWTFYGTIVFAVVYIVLYPAVPLVHEATGGILGYSSRAAVMEKLEAARAAQGGFVERIAAMDLEDIRKNDELARFAAAGGRSAFLVNCVPCHGSGAAGSYGYPNLNDDEWLWGGTPAAIRTTITHGVRFTADPETRVSQMPAFGAEGILNRDQIREVAEYVYGLSGRDVDPALAKSGAKVFADNCAACHGESGQGNPQLGAPSLKDAIWLYGDSRKDIMAQVSEPKQGVMPAWGDRLSPVTIKELAIYVHSLGGGQVAAASAGTE
jgi:cytochrome c oxidase cbb3-type subunit 3